MTKNRREVDQDGMQKNRSKRVKVISKASQFFVRALKNEFEKKKEFTTFTIIAHNPPNKLPWNEVFLAERRLLKHIERNSYMSYIV